MLQKAFVILALIFFLIGSFRRFKVYDNLKEEFGLRHYSEIGEYQLVKDATFSGTIRKGGELFSTYDRTSPKGKTGCPT